MLALHSRVGLRWIAVFEAAKGLLILLAGIGLLLLLHRDVRDTAEQLIRHFHLNPANRYPQIFLNAASQLTDSRLWLLALGALLYSLFRFTEAVGLWYQKRWAEWLGLFSGSLYVPIEAYELFEGVSWPKVLVLAVNLLIVAYLANVLVRTSREQDRTGSAGHSHE